MRDYCNKERPMTTQTICVKTPVLDEQVWRAWVEKNEKRDKIKLERAIRILAIVAVLIVLAALFQRVAP
jgi:hypothetical protein